MVDGLERFNIPHEKAHPRSTLAVTASSIGARGWTLRLQSTADCSATANAGKRPVFGDADLSNNDPHWRDLIPFYEYFHGDTGRGVGASHQTGWTGLIAAIIQEQSEHPVPRGWLTAISQEHGPEPKNSAPPPVDRLRGAIVRGTRSPS